VKSLTFFFLIVVFFNKIAIGNFVEKNDIYFFLNVKFLAIFGQSNGNFWTVKWQFSGGLGPDQL